MANALRKMANYLGLMDDPELGSEEEIDQTFSQPKRQEQKAKTYLRPATLAVAPITPAALQLDLPVLDRIITLHPRFYNEARTIGEQYREGNPVIINLTDMDESERKRLVDFASGLVFGLHGTIERVTSKVFLLSPANVRVSSEDKTAAAEASFFNQS
ncbi:MAG: cell division protein SepF [Actinobacteria bacterium]|nr:cell division protein SepF [Actinomycetota bacterium]